MRSIVARGVGGPSHGLRRVSRGVDAPSLDPAILELGIPVFGICYGFQTMAAALGGVDAFVFTAGIGERSAPIRERIAARLAWLGAELDAAANAAGKTSISRAGSRLPLYVIPTNEELMIARHTVAALSAARSGGTTFKRTA